MRNGPNVSHTRQMQLAAAGAGEANGASEHDEVRDGNGGASMTPEGGADRYLATSAQALSASERHVAG